MRQVSRDDFFTALYADSRDIMPTIVSGYPYKSEWADQKSQARTLFGVSQDTGERVNGLPVTQYFLVAA